MAQSHTGPSNAVASQVAELANAAVADAVQRRKLTAERVQHNAAVDAWFSRERAVLIACLIAVPVLAIVILVNVMDKSLLDMVTPSPTPVVARQLAKEALDTVVKRIDSFHNDYNELPGNLVEIGLPSPGTWTWAPRAGGQYSVTVKMFGETLTFDTRQRTPAQ